MTTSLTGTIKATLNLTLQDTRTDNLSTPQDPVNVSGPATQQITDGTGANQAQDMFHKDQSLAVSGTQDFNFFDGSISNSFGIAITWTALKLLYIENLSADSTIKLSGTLWDAITGGSTDQYLIPPGGFFLGSYMSAGGVTIGTADVLTLTHEADGTTTAQFKLLALGEN